MNFGTLVRNLGSMALRGVRHADWSAQLEANRDAVAPEYRVRAASITAMSRVNSALSRIEDRLLPAVREATVESPVFILGAPRSGTTFLQQLLATDSHFAFPTQWQTNFPNTFLTTERYVYGRLNLMLRVKNRRIDNIAQDFASPGEDATAICNMCCLSANMGAVFPDRANHFDRYLSLRDASPDEVERWKAAFMLFSQKLSWRYRKPLIFKSPQNTCRVKLLLELFPQAKFVYIHRHPLDVYPSLRRTMEFTYQHSQLSKPTATQLEERRIFIYRHLFDMYHEDKTQIPAGHFVEIGYDELTKNPVLTLEKIYSNLGLTHFERFRPQAEQACRQREGYQRNKFPQIPEEMQERLVDAWEPCFDEWGYDKTLRSSSIAAEKRAAESCP